MCPNKKGIQKNNPRSAQTNTPYQSYSEIREALATIQASFELLPVNYMALTLAHISRYIGVNDKQDIIGVDFLMVP